jgi:hypothetical protein
MMPTVLNMHVCDGPDGVSQGAMRALLNQRILLGHLLSSIHVRIFHVTDISDLILS